MSFIYCLASDLGGFHDTSIIDAKIYISINIFSVEYIHGSF